MRFTHANKVSVKLVKTNAMLCKMRHFVNETALRWIYFGIFHFPYHIIAQPTGQQINLSERLTISSNYCFY